MSCLASCFRSEAVKECNAVKIDISFVGIGCYRDTFDSIEASGAENIHSEFVAGSKLTVTFKEADIYKIIGALEAVDLRIRAKDQSPREILARSLGKPELAESNEIINLHLRNMDEQSILIQMKIGDDSVYDRLFRHINSADFLRIVTRTKGAYLAASAQITESVMTDLQEQFGLWNLWAKDGVHVNDEKYYTASPASALSALRR